MASLEANHINFNAITDEVADFLASSPTPLQITTFRLSEPAEQFIRDLLEVNRTRGLTVAEQAILDDYTRIEHLMQKIKVRAFAFLDQNNP